MNDLTPMTIRYTCQRTGQREDDVSGHELPVATLLSHVEQLEAENRRLLRGVEVIGTLGDGEGRRLARLILEGADTHAWRLGRQRQNEGEGKLIWNAGK